MQALILVGGLGTRLRKVVDDRPKPMALVNNKPFLEYLIDNLKRNNISNIILATGYMGEYIENYFKDGKSLGVNITYSKEEQQLGTGGALKNATRYISEDDLFILNGDTYFDVDYNSMYELHKKNGSYFTMALRKVTDVSRYGAVEYNNSKITSFVEKGEKSNSNYINGGIYIIKRELLNYIKPNQKVSLEQETIPEIMKRHDLYGFRCSNYFIDIGIPEDYLKFCEDITREELS